MAYFSLERKPTQPTLSKSLSDLLSPEKVLNFIDINKKKIYTTEDTLKINKEISITKAKGNRR